MIKALAAVLLAPAAFAAAPPASPAASAAPAAAPAPLPIGVSTYTISTLYTGDRVRDPFLPPSAGGPARPRAKGPGDGVDIHSLQLRGIIKDGVSDFALFKGDDGATLVLRGEILYDEHNKRVPGITGRIRIKQKRAELITADKDVQIFSLGGDDDESGAEQQQDLDKDDLPGPPAGSKQAGSGRSP